MGTVFQIPPHSGTVEASELPNAAAAAAHATGCIPVTAKNPADQSLDLVLQANSSRIRRCHTRGGTHLAVPGLLFPKPGTRSSKRTHTWPGAIHPGCAARVPGKARWRGGGVGGCSPKFGCGSCFLSQALVSRLDRSGSRERVSRLCLRSQPPQEPSHNSQPRHHVDPAQTGKGREMAGRSEHGLNCPAQM